MKKKYYIFDLDGTLCDSMGWWRQETAHIKDFRDFELMETAYVRMREHYRNDVQLKPGVREFLEKARAEGVKMCIATGTRRDVAEPFLLRTGLMEFMEFFIDCHEVGRFKEHPDIYLLAAERLGASRTLAQSPPKDGMDAVQQRATGAEISECAVFEDSDYSAKTAKRAGFYVVGIIDEVTSTEGDVRKFSDIAVKDWRELSCVYSTS